MTEASEPGEMRADDKKGVLIWCTTDGGLTGKVGGHS